MSIFYVIINWLSLVVYWLLFIIVISHIIIKRRTVSSTMAWLLFVYVMPLIGIITYIFISELYFNEYRIKNLHDIQLSTTRWLKELKVYKHIFARKNSSVASSIFELCKKYQGIAGIKGNQLQLFSNSNDVIQSLIHDIQLAQHNIEMVFYIWQPGGMIDLVAKSLISAEQRGIHCRLMLDSTGSNMFFRSNWAKIMRNAGIEIVEAMKLNLLSVFKRRIDVRQHRKMILIDNCIAYTGSMNMVDPRYFKQDAGVGQWIDIMIRIKGPIVIIMGIVYSYDWEIETGKRILILPDVNTIPFKQNNEHSIHIIASGPGFPANLTHQTLLTATYAARKYLIITTPYFVPSDDILHAICTAAQRGVDVSIIIPRKNNSVFVNWASRAFFKELLDAKVKIYQFKDGMLHTKSVLVDGELSLIGTANLDMRSLWLNFEITLVIDDTDFSSDLVTVQNYYISRSHLLNSYLWNKRPLWQQITECLFYFFSPLL